jgi:hypothetical protein
MSSSPPAPTVNPMEGSAASRRDGPSPNPHSQSSGALERLDASRERMRQALHSIAHPALQPSIFAGGLGNVGNNVRSRVRSLPMAAPVLEGLEAWWHKHPVHRAARIADAASAKFLAPAARRKPAAVLAIAVGLGILLAYAKPWRLLLRPAKLFGGITQVLKSALSGPSATAWKQAFKRGRARSVSLSATGYRT